MGRASSELQVEAAPRWTVPGSGWFANLRVRSKILLSALTVLAVGVAVGVAGLAGMSSMYERADHLQTEIVVPQTGLALAHQAEIKSRLDMLRIAMAGDDAETKDFQ